MPRPRKYPQELIERGVRLAIESGRPVRHVADDLGIHHETLRRHVRQAEADGGLRPDLPSTEEREEIKKLRREVFELRRTNEILKAASVFSRPSLSVVEYISWLNHDRLHGALGDIPPVEFEALAARRCQDMAR